MCGCRTNPRTAFHLATLYVAIAANGTYDSFTLNLGGRLARTEIHAELTGPGATAHLNAAQLLAGTQHADFTTVVRHAAPHGTSRQTVKNVLAGRSRGVFQGRIEVARHAQKTDGYQMNQALLLSPDAEIDSKPELEIFADDVKCSHGATVGELDAEQLFYLRSRGIPDAEARVDPGARLPGRGDRSRHARSRARHAGARGRTTGGRDRQHERHDPSCDASTSPASARISRSCADRARQAAGVPRQRRLGAEAARGDRRDARRDGTRNTPTCIAACTG